MSWGCVVHIRPEGSLSLLVCWAYKKYIWELHIIYIAKGGNIKLVRGV